MAFPQLVHSDLAITSWRSRNCFIAFLQSLHDVPAIASSPSCNHFMTFPQLVHSLLTITSWRSRNWFIAFLQSLHGFPAIASWQDDNHFMPSCTLLHGEMTTTSSSFSKEIQSQSQSGASVRLRQ